MEMTTRDREEQLQLAKECYEESRERFYEGKLMDAEQLATRAKDIFLKEKEFEGYADACNSLGVIYDGLGNEAASLDNYLEGYRIADKYDLKVPLAIFMINLGARFQGLGALDDALDFFKKASVIMAQVGTEEERYPTFQLILYMNLAALCREKGDYDKAMQYLNEAIPYKDHPRNVNYKMAWKACECYVRWSCGEEEWVRDHIADLHDSLMEGIYESDYMEYMSDVCHLYQEMKEYDKWLEVLNMIESNLSDEDGYYTVLRVDEMFMNYYQELGDSAKYMEYCVKFAETSQQKKSLDDSDYAGALRMRINYLNDTKLRKKAENMMMKDPLTGIGSRHKMLKDSIGVLESSRLNKNVIGIGLIDVDFFKQCNDTYGHIQGDECLRKVAKVLQEEIAEIGDVYRFGGDEFLLLFGGDLTVAHICEMGQRIKDKMEALAIPNEESSISKYVTLSQGYTAAIAEEGDSVDTLVGYADKVLYEVKRNGRNDFKYMRLTEIVDLGE